MLEDIALGGAGFAVLMNITGVAIPIWNIWNAREHLGLLDLMEQVIILAIYWKHSQKAEYILKSTYLLMQTKTS